MRPGEAWRLKWIDIDFVKKAVNITPEKGSNPGAPAISDKLLAMLQRLPKKSDHIFKSGSLKHFGGGFKQAVRVGNWKALRSGLDKPLELYDLATDLGEERDVAAQQPDVVRKIEDYLETARTDSECWPVRR